MSDIFTDQSVADTAAVGVANRPPAGAGTPPSPARQVPPPAAPAQPTKSGYNGVVRVRMSDGNVLKLGYSGAAPTQQDLADFAEQYEKAHSSGPSGNASSPVAPGLAPHDPYRWQQAVKAAQPPQDPSQDTPKAAAARARALGVIRGMQPPPDNPPGPGPYHQPEIPGGGLAPASGGGRLLPITGTDAAFDQVAPINVAVQVAHRALKSAFTPGAAAIEDLVMQNPTGAAQMFAPQNDPTMANPTGQPGGVGFDPSKITVDPAAAFGRGYGQGILPSASGVVGATMAVEGANGLLSLVPVANINPLVRGGVTLVSGGLGAAGGGKVITDAQQWLMDHILSPAARQAMHEDQQRIAQQQPAAFDAGQIASQGVFMKPTLSTAPKAMLQRAIGGGMAAGMNVAQQKIAAPGKPLDVPQMARQAVGGTLFSDETAAGEAASHAGTAAVKPLVKAAVKTAARVMAEKAPVVAMTPGLATGTSAKLAPPSGRSSSGRDAQPGAMNRVQGTTYATARKSAAAPTPTTGGPAQLAVKYDLDGGQILQVGPPRAEDGHIPVIKSGTGMKMPIYMKPDQFHALPDAPPPGSRGAATAASTLTPPSVKPAAPAAQAAEPAIAPQMPIRSADDYVQSLQAQGYDSGTAVIHGALADTAARRWAKDTGRPVADWFTEHMPQPSPSQSITGFQTSKGSTYEVSNDGTTTRNKAARARDLNDEGAKPQSERTLYLPIEATSALAEPFHVTGPSNQRAIIDGDKVYTVQQNADGNWSRSGVFPYETQPRVGLSPLELWGAQDHGDGRTSFGKVHAGNEITKVQTAATTTTGEGTIQHGTNGPATAEGAAAGASAASGLREQPTAAPAAAQANAGGGTSRGNLAENGRPAASSGSGNESVRAATAAPETATPDTTGDSAAAATGVAPHVQYVNPHDIGVDPELQYKRSGVTDTKNFVTDELKNQRDYRIDPLNPLTLWRDENGSLFAVNGHHRRELAQRAGRFVTEQVTNGKRTLVPSADRKVPAVVLDAKDGWTKDMVRVRGALENMRDNKGTALDAADALHALGDPDEMAREVRGLPKSALARDVAGLVKLDQPSRDAVRNGEVAQPAAAAIGDVLGSDPERVRVAMEQARGNGIESYKEAATMAAGVRDEPIVRRGESGQLGFDGFDNDSEFISTAGAQAKIRTALDTRLKGEKSNLLATDRTEARPGEQFDTEGRRADAAAVGEAKSKAALLLDHDPEVKAALRDAAARQVRGEMTTDAAVSHVREALLANAHRTPADVMQRASDAANPPTEHASAEAEGQEALFQRGQKDTETGDLFGGPAAPGQTGGAAGDKGVTRQRDLFADQGVQGPARGGMGKSTYDQSSLGGMFDETGASDAQMEEGTGAPHGQDSKTTGVSPRATTRYILQPPEPGDPYYRGEPVFRGEPLLSPIDWAKRAYPDMTEEQARENMALSHTKQALYNRYRQMWGQSNDKTVVDHYQPDRGALFQGGEDEPSHNTIGGTITPGIPAAGAPPHGDLSHTNSYANSVRNSQRALLARHPAGEVSASFKPDVPATVRALRNPDPRTATRDLAGVLRSALYAEVQSGASKRFDASDLSYLERVYGVETSNRGTGQWGKASSDRFAGDWERYLHSGQAPTPRLRQVFDAFRAWLTRTYASLKGTPLEGEIHPAVRNVFDRLLVGDEARPASAPAAPPPPPGEVQSGHERAPSAVLPDQRAATGPDTGAAGPNTAAGNRGAGSGAAGAGRDVAASPELPRQRSDGGTGTGKSTGAAGEPDRVNAGYGFYDRYRVTDHASLADALHRASGGELTLEQAEATARLYESAFRGIAKKRGVSVSQVYRDNARYVLAGDSILARELGDSGTARGVLIPGSRFGASPSDRHTLLALLSKPDASTAVHELGHIFLENLRPADQAIVRRWLNGTGRTDLAIGQNEPFEVAHHEAFAQGFERSVRDGRVLHPSLTGVYARFQQFLANVYTKVVLRLNNASGKMEPTGEVHDRAQRFPLFDDDVVNMLRSYAGDVSDLGDLGDLGDLEHGGSDAAMASTQGDSTGGVQRQSIQAEPGRPGTTTGALAGPTGHPTAGQETAGHSRDDLLARGGARLTPPRTGADVSGPGGHTTLALPAPRKPGPLAGGAAGEAGAPGRSEPQGWVTTPAELSEPPAESQQQRSSNNSNSSSSSSRESGQFSSGITPEERAHRQSLVNQASEIERRAAEKDPLIVGKSGRFKTVAEAQKYARGLKDAAAKPTEEEIDGVLTGHPEPHDAEVRAVAGRAIRLGRERAQRAQVEAPGYRLAGYDHASGHATLESPHETDAKGNPERYHVDVRSGESDDPDSFHRLSKVNEQLAESGINRRVISKHTHIARILVKNELGGEATPLPQDILFQRGLNGEDGEATHAAVAPAFYSQLERVIGQKMGGRATPEQIRGMIDPAKGSGVKADEVKWTGLDDLLDQAQKDGRSLTKAEVLDHLKANAVQVGVIRRGGSDAKTAIDNATRYMHQAGAHWDDARDVAERAAQGDRSALDEAAEYGLSEHEFKSPASNATQYSGYQMPGGSNYREVQMALPNRDAEAHAASIARYNAAMQELADAGLPRNATPYQITQKLGEEAANRIDRARMTSPDNVELTGKNTYVSPHWDEPNVLAHVRMNDRTGPNGEKVLHVEEVQSDWHQEGRKKGYRGEPNQADLAAFKSDVMAAARKNSADIGKVGSAVDRIIKNPIDSPGNPTTDAWDTLHRAVGNDVDLNRVHDIRDANDEGPPPAPFSKTWHEMALKHVLRHAAENGYDRVSWTPGEEQAKRYDLSRQVNRVVVPSVTESGRSIRIDNPDGSSFKMMVDNNGRVQGYQSASQFTGKKLDEVVGADLAEKIMTAQSPTEFSGNDLSVGGSGMKGFYDKIVPDFLNKFGKRFGAKVEPTQINAGAISGDMSKYSDYRTLPRSDGSVVVEGKLADGGSWNVLSHEVNNRDAERLIGKYKTQGQGTTVSSIPITDAMRASVLREGQPLFQKGTEPEAGDFYIAADGREHRVAAVNPDGTLNVAVKNADGKHESTFKNIPPDWFTSERDKSDPFAASGDAVPQLRRPDGKGPRQRKVEGVPLTGSARVPPPLNFTSAPGEANARGALARPTKTPKPDIANTPTTGARLTGPSAAVPPKGSAAEIAAMPAKTASDRVEIAGRQVGAMVRDLMSAARAAKASGNLHHMGRQMGYLGPSNPKAWLMGSADGIRAGLPFLGAKYDAAAHAEMKADPLWQPYQALQNAVRKDSGTLDEEFEPAGPITQFAEKYYPGVSMSHRAFRAALDRQGFEYFKSFTGQMAKAGVTQKDNPQAFKDAVDFIMTAQGRRPLNSQALEKLFGATLFSRRFAASRFRLMNPAYYRGLSPDARVQAIKGAAAYSGFVLSSLALAHMAGAKVVTNPDDPDFGQINVGKYHYDISAGMRTELRFMLQAGSIVRKGMTGEKLPRGKGPVDALFDLAKNHFRQKMSPGAGALVTAFDHKNAIGDKATVGQQIEDTMIPMYVADVWKAYASEDGDAVKALGATAPAFFGTQVRVGGRGTPREPSMPDGIMQRLIGGGGAAGTNGGGSTLAPPPPRKKPSADGAARMY